MRGVVLLIFGVALFSPLSAETPANKARYDNYRLYYVHIDTEEHVKLFQDIETRSDSCEFIGHARYPGKKLSILVAAHKIAEIDDLLQTFKVKHEILSENFQEKIDAQWNDVMPKDTNPRSFDWDHYFHLETIENWMESLVNKYDFVELVETGESVQGRPLRGLKIAIDNRNPTIFVESGIHAREWIAPATATYIINELLNSADPAVKRIASDFNWIIFPVVNPDGYKYSFEGDRMWRKNRNLFGTCRGVDLNRNFPYHWNETGSSSNPCRFDYAGPSAASEPETQAIMKYITDNRKTQDIRTYFSLHSYSQLIMFPYGTDEKATTVYDLTLMGIKAVHAIQNTTGQVYQSGSIRQTIYPSSGSSTDWMHKIPQIPVTFTFELRGPPNSPDLFILPADQIKDTAREILAAFVAILEEARSLEYYS